MIIEKFQRAVYTSNDTGVETLSLLTDMVELID